MNKTQLHKTVQSALGPKGFTKKGASWYFAGADATAVVTLQKSNYDNTWFINLGFWLRALGETEFPKESKCHVRLRGDSLDVPDECRPATVLDLDAPALADQTREVLLRVLFEEHIAPFVLRMVEIEGLKREFSAGTLARAFLHWQARYLIV